MELLLPARETATNHLRNAILAGLLISACRLSRERPPVASGASQIRLALLQSSYWGGGFDRPVLLAFADGTIIYPHSTARGIPTAYRALRLTPRGIDSVLSELGVDSTVRALNESYDFAPNVTDQHSFYLLVPNGDRLKLVTMRAALRDSAHLRPEAPFAFGRLYEHIQAFAPASGVEWHPDSVEVSVWPYEYAPDNPPLSWPRDWPSATDPRWHRYGDLVGEVRTLRLPFADVPRLDSILTVRREKQAIELGGKKWAIGYRWIMPHENEWAWLRQKLES